MGVPWNLAEARLIQDRSAGSAANADALVLPAVPLGKIWVVQAVGYFPDVAETQTVSFEKIGASGGAFSLLNPVSLALNPAKATFIEQGMDYPLFPSEYIIVRRGNHTAGSTMICAFQFIEIDMPLYNYEEPQVVKRENRAISSIRQALGGSRASITRPPAAGAERGGRTGPLPK